MTMTDKCYFASLHYVQYGMSLYVLHVYERVVLCDGSVPELPVLHYNCNLKIEARRKCKRKMEK